MDSECVLQWQMHGGDTFVSFLARRAEEGYGVVVTRDNDALLFTDTAADAAALFQKSQDLRTAFRQMGYLPKPIASRASRLPGGVCWGPAAPVTSLLFQALTQSAYETNPAA